MAGRSLRIVFESSNHSLLDFTLPSSLCSKCIINGILRKRSGRILEERLFRDVAQGFCGVEVIHKGCSPSLSSLAKAVHDSLKTLSWQFLEVH